MPARRSTGEDGPTEDRPPGDGASGVPWSPRNLLVPYLLLALSVYRAHGYLLQQYLQGMGFFGVDTTTIYRNLRHLEKQGLVSSAWDTDSQGPARRVYSLTDAGRTFLNTWAGALGNYRTFLDQFFSMYQDPALTRGSPEEDAQ